MITETKPYQFPKFYGTLYKINDRTALGKIFHAIDLKFGITHGEYAREVMTRASGLAVGCFANLGGKKKM